MGEVDELTLKRSIKQRSFSPVYLFYGEEAYLKKVYCDMITDVVVDPDFTDFNYHLFEGKDTQLDDVYAADLNMPIMSEYSCVVVRDYPLDKLQKSTEEKFKELLSDLNENCILIFVCDDVSFSGVLSAKQKDILKAVGEAGTVVHFGKKTTGEISRILVNGCNRRGCTMTNSTASYLVSCAGDDLNTLLNEVEKLCAYASGREITTHDIDLICTKTLESRVFDLSAAILHKDSGKSFEILENLYAQKEPPEKIMGALSSQYIDMYRAKAAADNGFPAKQVADYYDYRKKSWKLEKSLASARRYSSENLRKLLGILSDADLALKTTGSDDRLIIEQMILKLMMVPDR